MGRAEGVHLVQAHFVLRLAPVAEIVDHHKVIASATLMATRIASDSQPVAEQASHDLGGHLGIMYFKYKDVSQAGVPSLERFRWRERLISVIVNDVVTTNLRFVLDEVLWLNLDKTTAFQRQ